MAKTRMKVAKRHTGNRSNLLNQILNTNGIIQQRDNQLSRKEFVRKSLLFSAGLAMGSLFKPSVAEALSYVNLQSSTPGTSQTGHFNITGTGIVGTLKSTATATNLFSGNINIRNSALVDRTKISLGRIILTTSAGDLATAQKIDLAAADSSYGMVRGFMGGNYKYDNSTIPGDYRTLPGTGPGVTYIRGVTCNTWALNGGQYNTFDAFHAEGNAHMDGSAEAGLFIGRLLFKGSGTAWGCHFHVVKDTDNIDGSSGGNIVALRAQIDRNDSSGTYEDRCIEAFGGGSKVVKGAAFRASSVASSGFLYGLDLATSLNYNSFPWGSGAAIKILEGTLVQLSHNSYSGIMFNENVVKLVNSGYARFFTSGQGAGIWGGDYLFLGGPASTTYFRFTGGNVYLVKNGNIVAVW